MVSYYRAEFVVTYPGSIRFPSSVNGSVCGNGKHSRSLGNFQICPGFYFPFCIVFTMSICAASGLFRSVWLAWAFSGLYWACTSLSQACVCPSYANAGPPYLPTSVMIVSTNNTSRCGHCPLFQIESLWLWQKNFQSSLLPWQNPAFTKLRGDGTTTAYHRFSFLLSKVSSV